MFVGLMGGEILGRQRQGLNRVATLAMFGRPPYRLGSCSDRCFMGPYGELAIAAAQSVLRSRSKQETFVREFTRRRMWQKASRPGRLIVRAMSNAAQGGFENQADMLILACALSPVLQGSGCRPVRWVRAVVEHYRIGNVMPAVELVAQAAQYSILVDDLWQKRGDIWAEFVDSAENDSLHNLLQRLTPAMESNWGLSRATALIDHDETECEDIDRLVVLALYSWLRNCNRFRFAIERTITLGGCTRELGAIVGALAGMGAGPDKIPFEWSTSINAFPHNRKWFRKLSRRLTDWPHGSDDLLKAPAMPSQFVGQLIRNLAIGPGMFLAPLVRLPCRLRAAARAMGRGGRSRFKSD